MRWLVYPLLTLLAFTLGACDEDNDKTWNEYDANAVQDNCTLNGYTWNDETKACEVDTRKSQ